MQKWVISANGKIYNHAAAFVKFGYIDWTQKANFSVGDEVYIYCTKPYQKIMYKTRVVTKGLTFSEITDDREFWYDISKYEKERSGHFVRLQLIEQADNDYLSYDELKKNGLKAPPQGPIKMKDELSNYVDKFLNDNLQFKSSNELEVPKDCYEGAKNTIEVNKYERSSIARMKCIEKYGCKCIVCGMDFEKQYGELGKGFIHVHHIVPISTIGENYRIDYEKDLVPVCPNCHAMLHRNGQDEILTVEELKIILMHKRKKTH